MKMKITYKNCASVVIQMNMITGKHAKRRFRIEGDEDLGLSKNCMKNKEDCKYKYHYLSKKY